MVDKVNQNDTSQTIVEAKYSAEEMLKAQQKITELQEQLILYQSREILEKARLLEEQQKEISRQKQLSPDQDATL